MSVRAVSEGGATDRHTICCVSLGYRTLRKNDKFVTCGGGVGVFSEPRSFGCAQDDPLPGVNFQSFCEWSFPGAPGSSA